MRTDDIKKLIKNGFWVIRPSDHPEPHAVEEAVLNDNGEIEWKLFCSCDSDKTRDYDIEGFLRHEKTILD